MGLIQVISDGMYLSTSRVSYIFHDNLREFLRRHYGLGNAKALRIRDCRNGEEHGSNYVISAQG